MMTISPTQLSQLTDSFFDVFLSCPFLEEQGEGQPDAVVEQAGQLQAEKVQNNTQAKQVQSSSSWKKTALKAVLVGTALGAVGVAGYLGYQASLELGASRMYEAFQYEIMMSPESSTPCLTKNDLMNTVVDNNFLTMGSFVKTNLTDLSQKVTPLLRDASSYLTSLKSAAFEIVGIK